MGSEKLATTAMIHLRLLVSLSLVALSLGKLESICETLKSKIHITKEEFSKSKELMRTCEEDVEINKCEGSCVSTTMPSAMEKSGFSKDCKCCRETSYNREHLPSTIATTKMDDSLR